jgi:hypothetical protein
MDDSMNCDLSWFPADGIHSCSQTGHTVLRTGSVLSIFSQYDKGEWRK